MQIPESAFITVAQIRLLPVTIDYVEGGLQIHPHKEFDPDWHVRFKGKLVRAGFPTVLADLE
jgi:hypothetical protein